jgi:acetyl esterase/lipase
MKVQKINLKEEYEFLEGGQLDCLLMDYPWDAPDMNWKRPALIVVPGGGYGMVSKREGEPIATSFFAKGFQVFTLWYLVAPDARYPEQLLELSAAVDYVKKHAEEFGVNPDEVFAVGFSAGGHLVGNLAVEHQNVAQKVGVALDCKPTAVGLSYPVISRIDGHLGSYENLLNGYTDEAKDELYKTLNLNEAVSACTPPAFIWATADDGLVPASNALRYALALANQGITYEVHVYPHGAHGLATATAEINAEGANLARISRWIDDCAAFFHLYTEEKF